MKIVAHRGASAGYPENTMPAFLAAWAAGADGIELDIHRTRDGRWLVIHDGDGVRTAGVNRRVADCDSREAAEWDVGVWKGPAFAGTRPPFLEDVLSRAPAGSIVLIEVKDAGRNFGALADIVAQDRGIAPAFLSFDRAAAARLKAAAPAVPVYWNCTPENLTALRNLVEEAGKSGLTGISVGWSGWMNELEEGVLTALPVPCAVWTVNDRAAFSAAKSAGASMLITDRPEDFLPGAGHA